MPDRPRVVLDTQVFLRALINPYSLAGHLFAERSADYLLYLSDEIEAEVLAVLNRPKVRARFPQITDSFIAVLKLILQRANRVKITAADLEARCRDPKDEIFLACAKVAQATYLVSEDQDLLVLERHHSTRIVTVATFLSLLDQASEP